MSSNATTNETNEVTSLPSTSKTQTANEVIAANVQLLMEQLEAGHSKGLTAYLTVMGRFHNYSFGNILEIARQKPHATRVSGMHAWNQLGRKVIKGQKGTLLDDLDQDSLARLAADGFHPCAIVETSPGNFQAWLKHATAFPKSLGTFAAQTLAARYDADPSAADWRRFGRLPGFTNCKPQYRKTAGLFPFVHLHGHTGQQYPMAMAFEREINKLYQDREQEYEAQRLQRSLSPRRGPRFSSLSLERFRTSTKYQDRPAAADIAFCVAAYAHGMDEDRIGGALEDHYLSRDPSPSRRAAYIRRTMAKARRWAER